MVNYFIYAKDFSGSTRGDRHYHINGMKTFEQFKSDVEKMEKEILIEGEPPTESKIIYLHWGDECYEVDEYVTKQSYSCLEGGNMGTQPEAIIEWIKKNCNTDNNFKIKLLYIITDGMIYDRSAEKCFQLNENMHYDTVVFHAFNEQLDLIDLSVAASFFKGRCIVHRNYVLYDNIDISIEFYYEKINISNFDAEMSNLFSYIQLKYIKNFKHDAVALQEIDKLKKLRNRLFDELLSKPREYNLDTKNKDVFLSRFIRSDWYRSLKDGAANIRIEIEKYISTLINYIVNEKKSYSFDALKFINAFSKPVEEEPIVDVNFAPEQKIEFPDIILNDDGGIPVIIITKFSLLKKIIFHTTKESAPTSPASFSKFSSAMECPLFLLNDTDISESIGYFYTLNVYKQLLINNKKTEPRTRRRFRGGLVITDTDEFDKYNDYVLSATYFNCRKIKYNIGLFYFVLWKNCENKEWMDRNVVEQFKKYTMRRISTTVCKIGLSSLPLDPHENTSLLTALWYCVELSSCIFKDDSEHFMHERLRMFHGVAHSMIEILKYFNYDLDFDSIKKRRELISNVMILKNIPRHKDKIYYLLESIFKNIEGFLVCEIENPFNLYKLNYLKLYHKGVLSDAVVNDKIHLNEYVHLMHVVEGMSEICEKTFRPFFAIDENKSFYSELANTIEKVVIRNDDDKDKIKITYESINCLEFDKIMSMYNLFIKCVLKLKKYPTLPEYVEHISKRKKFNGNLVTIFPPDVYSDAEYAYAQYQKVMTKVDIDTFIKVCKTYVKRSERIKAEGIVKYNNDNEIQAFISREEVKVNLVKKT